MYNILVQQRKRPLSIETTYSKARQNLAKLLDEVTKNQETVVIKRRRGEGVVMMSETEASSLFETAHLLRSPKNAIRLLTALEGAIKGEGCIKITAADLAKMRSEITDDLKKP
jgi:antitoxin YefM